MKTTIEIEKKWIERLLEVAKEASEDKYKLNFLFGYIESARTLIKLKLK